jgi:hypothetical protein
VISSLVIGSLVDGDIFDGVSFDLGIGMVVNGLQLMVNGEW